jgi:hypothetical protein
MGVVLGDMAGESCGLVVPVESIENGAVLVFVALLGATGCAVCVVADVGGVVDSLSSSGIVGQYVLSTCLSAGRRIGFDKKKSMPESRHSYVFVSACRKNV